MAAAGAAAATETAGIAAAALTATNTAAAISSNNNNNTNISLQNSSIGRGLGAAATTGKHWLRFGNRQARTVQDCWLDADDNNDSNGECAMSTVASKAMAIKKQQQTLHQQKLFPRLEMYQEDLPCEYSICAPALVCLSVRVNPCSFRTLSPNLPKPKPPKTLNPITSLTRDVIGFNVFGV